MVTMEKGLQDFAKLREERLFYIDKTSFIKEWWEDGAAVTQIIRPHGFGKTLNMSMMEEFFSVDYRGRGDLFEGLSIWKEEKYRNLQGTYPVIRVSFAGIKETDFESAKNRIKEILMLQFKKYAFLTESDKLSSMQKERISRLSREMDDLEADMSLCYLSEYLSRHYGKKVIILMDECDTPMQQAYLHGYWNEMESFTRGFFISTFKANPDMYRGILTGITRVPKEADFSGFNNLIVITATSKKYATSFGFTEDEVFTALETRGMSGEKEKVKEWYDGFVFGKHRNIYNPSSILNFLDNGKHENYRGNTDFDSLAGKLIKEGDSEIKQSMEQLLKGEHLFCPIDEEIIYNQLEYSGDALWSFLVAGGYLKILDYEDMAKVERWPNYELAITNKEVLLMFQGMISGWFGSQRGIYNRFITAMLTGNVEEMNEYMNEISCELFSYFDTGKRVSKKAQPERFYQGFVLGLLVDLKGRYYVTSNRESGFGRYDIMLEPVKKEQDDAIIIEFKVFNPRKEQSIEETVVSALNQIEEKRYEAALVAKGIPKEKIRKYSFAFEGKNVLIG